MRWTPHATVAAIVEHEGRFLLVEEVREGRRVINQPAGHLEQGESFEAAARREVLEETAWEIEITGLLGLYVYRSPLNNVTYHRTCFIGHPLRQQPNRTLDEGIEAAVWLSRSELLARKAEWRSPLVLTCIDDYLSGRYFPLDYIRE